MKGRLEDIELGVDKVDATVPEWMGYFLLFEGMLDSVIYARDHYLSSGGKLLPNKCNISIVGTRHTSKYTLHKIVFSQKTKITKQRNLEETNVINLSFTNIL